jgi:ATP-binding protein involved in chromosome partitioning
MLDKALILEALSNVTDPTTGRDIVMMQMIRDLRIEGNQVNFTLLLPSLNIQNKSELNFACMSAIQEVYPQADVNIHLMARSASETQANSVLPQVRNIIAVASGKGGVGKSTVATNLACALREMGAKVGLIDADLYGPSIPTMFGLQDRRPKVEDVYGSPKLMPLEAHGLYLMSIGFIVDPEQAVVLRGPRLAGILKQFINDTLWPDLDYLIIDLPPGTGDIQLSLVQTVPLTGAVIVTTPQEVAVVDAVKAMNMFLLPQVNVPILGIVENMAWFTPEELPDNKYYLFGQGGGVRLAKLANTLLLGQIPIVQGIREAGDLGKPIVLHNEPITKRAFMTVAENTVRAVMMRNESMAATQRVEVG